MKNLLLPIVLAFTLTSYAQEAQSGPSSRYFKVVPISEAHQTFGHPQEETLNPKSINVLIWNIKKALVIGWEEEFNFYGKNQDLFLLQEAYENDIFLNTLNSFRNIRWDMGRSFLYRAYGDTATGNMIGSEVAPSQFIVRHSPNREPVTNTPKAMTIGTYPVGENAHVLVISIHGINFNSNAAFRRHMEQAAEEIRKHSGPVIFAGDFNTHTNGRESYLAQLAEELDLDEVEFKNSEYRTRAPVTGNYFDHAFVRGLKVSYAEVMKESLASDHRPMKLTLSLISQKH